MGLDTGHLCCLGSSTMACLGRAATYHWEDIKPRGEHWFENTQTQSLILDRQLSGCISKTHGLSEPPLAYPMNQ